jgi:predicted N-acyltransferase
MIAERAGQPVAASFFLRDADALYGRYWGAVEYIPCLHFEACYYQAIAYAIAEGIGRFEGGAQGEHKLSRGLEPVRTTSAHWLADPRFADAVADFLARERGGVEDYLDELSERLPYRAGEAP